MVTHGSNKIKQKIYTIASISGLDYNSAPMNILDTQTPNAKNVYFEGGNVIKRRGTKVVVPQHPDALPFMDLKAEQVVHSTYVLPNENAVIAHIGQYLVVYNKDSETGNFEVLSESNNVSVDFAMEDLGEEYNVSSFMVQQNDYVYLFTSAGIVRITLTFGTIIRPVAGSTRPRPVVKFTGFEKLAERDLYAPITTSNIIYDGYEIASGTNANYNLEQVNLLTRYRRNTLIASNAIMWSELWNINEDGTTKAETKKASLDGKILGKKPEKIHVHYYKRVLNPTTDEEKAIFIPAECDCTIADVGATDSTVFPNSCFVYIDDFYVDENGNDIANTPTAIMIVTTNDSDETSKIELLTDIGNPLSGVANVEITYQADIEDNSSRILDCTFSQLYQDGSNLATLFVSGNSELPNADWHTSATTDNAGTYSDFTYFPDLSYTYLGTSNSKIVGYQISNDGYLITYKSRYNNEPTIYFRKSSLAYIGTGVANETLYDLTFPVTQGISGETPYGSNCIVNFYNENLFYGKRGVYALTLNEDLYGTIKYAYPRSTLITNVFATENFDRSVSFSYDNRLYISFYESGHVYIADTTNLIKIGSSVEYQWWVFTDIYVQRFFTIDDTLYYFNRYGQICKFTKGQGDLETYADSNRISCFDNGGIGAAVSDINAHTIAYYQIDKNIMNSIIDNVTTSPLVKFYLYDESTGFIVEIDHYDSETGRLYPCMTLVTTEIEGLYTLDNLELIVCNAIQASIQTKPIIFDSLTTSKNVTSMTFTSGAYKEITECNVALILRNFESSMFPAIQDPMDLDFSSFTFDKVFLEKPSYDIKTFTRPLYLRNINSLALRFYNDGFSGMSISAIQLIYNYTANNRGYR